MKVITTISATLSGNRGAEAMLRSIIENVTTLIPDASFNILSVYPHDDFNENDYVNATIIDGRPKVFMIRCFVEALLTKYFSKMQRLRLCSASRALKESDLVLDLSGVSFVDGRGFPILVYNAQCVLIPKWFGAPIMKVSQALGPFDTQINRAFAKFILPKVDIIAARGMITSSYLTSIGISHEQCSDVAFSLPDRDPLPETIRQMVDNIKRKGLKIIGLCPSVVVKEYCDQRQMDYINIMEMFVKELSVRGFVVLMFAHSARYYTSKAKNNDLPLCRDLYARGQSIANFYFIDQLMNARELRRTIAECDLFVGSRFHSVISSLCVETPFFLIGWSHKYSEVLDSFQMAEMALDFKELNVSKLVSKFEEMEQNVSSLVARMKTNIKAVKLRSFKNAELVADLLGRNNETQYS